MPVVDYLFFLITLPTLQALLLFHHSMDHNPPIPNPIHLLLLLLQPFPAALAQSPALNPSTPSHNTGGFSTITASLFSTLVILFFIIALFTLCFHQRRYGNSSSSNVSPNRITVLESGEPGQRRAEHYKGVERSLLESFPIMEYKAVRKMSDVVIKGPLECAVCLSEFTDDESLRLLPGCCHVFHPDCIDLWLESHVTCPVCRADVSKMSSSGYHPDAIDVLTTDTDVDTGTATSDQEGASGDASVSMGMAADRFTLRLPRHVMKEIEEARKYRRSVSIAGYAYERKGSMSDGGGRSGRLLGFIRSLSNVMRRDHHEAGSSTRSFRRVFTLTDVDEVPPDRHRSAVEAFSSGENEEEKRVSSVSEMALLDRV